MVFRDVVVFDRAKNKVIIISNIFLEEEGLEDGVKKPEKELKNYMKFIFN